MSVTLAELLKLPSLSNATVLGGHNCLNKPVFSINVLECTAVTHVRERLLSNIAFLGGELVITAFSDIKDDVEAQCTNLRRLAEVGEIGVILYYVGILMPKVDPKLIETADRLDFALICMPENRFDLRYSEVISEVMEAIIKAQMTDDRFQTEIIERMSRLPVYQRNINSALQMISDRVRATLFLTDVAGHALNSVFWPRALSFSVEKIIQLLDDSPTVLIDEQMFYVSHLTLSGTGGPKLVLYLLRQTSPLKKGEVSQAAEVIQVALNLWSSNHGYSALPELVRAILQDEPLKMKRIANAFQVDVESIDSMWVVTPCGSQQPDGKLQRFTLSLVRDELSHLCGTIVADIYDENVIAMTSSPAQKEEMMTLAEYFSLKLEQAGIPATVSVCLNLENTAAFRSAYLLIEEAITTARTIYPEAQIFTLQMIQFAADCQRLLEQGAGAAQTCMELIDGLRHDPACVRSSLLETLTVYLLDAESDLERTADRLFLHKNTIKYRLQKIAERLGFSIGRLPETLQLYRAVALHRILLTRYDS
ncbi:MAG: PucR family transcriptional regulator [Peptococcaceae bacterium]|nr:PucR family transcriptional regulator [Peptococcaceae bacterium]